MSNKIKHLYKKKPKSNFSFFAICVFTGSVFEDNNEKGVSHLIEHLLFRNKSINSNFKSLTDKLNKLGVSTNAYTSHFFTVFYISTPNIHIKEVLNILFRIVFCPKFNIKSIQDEKKIVINELLEKNNSPDIYTLLLSNEIIFDKSNPLHYSIGGSINSVNKLNKKIITDYYNKFYSINNSLLFSYTSKNKKYINSIINLYTKKYDNRNTFQNNFNNINKFLYKLNTKQKITYSFESQFPKNKSSFVLFVFLIKQPISSKELLSLYIFKNFLVDNMSSLLYTKLREEKKLIYSISSEINNFLSYYTFNIYFNVNKLTKYKCVNIVRNCLKYYSTHLIDKKNFTKFKDNLKFKFEENLENEDFIFNNTIVNFFLYNINKSCPDYYKDINNIDRYYVKKSLKKYINEKKMFIFYS